MERTILSVLIIACLHLAQSENTTARRRVGNLERAVAFSVLEEIRANRLQRRKDVCVAFGSGSTVNEEQVLSLLKRSGVTIHPNDWCGRAPRGLRIDFVPPAKEVSPNTYEFVIQLGDLSGIQKGEHFATLLRKGTYVVECKNDSEPRLVEYRKICCPPRVDGQSH